MLTPSPSATRFTAASSAWNGAQPPAAATKRWYFICDQVSSAAASGSGTPSQRSLSRPPATVP